jgi:preprotein translocase subunit SecE
MDKRRESHIIPALVAVVGIIAFAVLVYLLLAGADWLINRLLGSSAGTPI